jgi:putative tRNA adenosine deaminase-associated protein
VPYFTAVLARDGDKWFPRDVDLETLESLDELADALRAREVGDAEPVLAFIEREDSWWAVVRVDGDEDPRVFVSDVLGAAASSYSELLEIAAVDEEVGGSAGGCGGDLDLLADLGSSPEDLQEICDDEMLPMDALAAVAEAGGFAEVLDSLR